VHATAAVMVAARNTHFLRHVKHANAKPISVSSKTEISLITQRK